MVTALSVIGILWYLIGRNRSKHNPLPLIFLALAWILELVAVFVTEHDDSNAVGPDIGLNAEYSMQCIEYSTL